MKKLRLDVEALEVESFQAAEEQESRSTVLAADAGATLPPYCVTFTCGDSVVRPCLDD